MEEEKKVEKKVEVKEKPLGGAQKVEETKVEVTDRPSPEHGRAEDMAGKGGEVIGKGLKKVASVVGGFAAGVSKEMRAGEAPKQEEQARQTESRSEHTERVQEAPQAKVVEKTEKKVTEEKE